MPLRAAVVPAFVASAFVSAQATWSAAATAPPGSSELVWDDVHGRLLAVDAFLDFPSGSSVEMRLWQWEGSGWARILGERIPGSLAAAVFDSGRGRLVALGSNAIHEWDGGRWSHQVVASPSFDACVYDVARHRVVAIDGQTIREWDGTQWLLGPNLPSPRTGVALAYDSGRQRCLLYGGSIGSAAVAELWSWDGTTLALLDANSAPGPLAGASLAYEPTTGRMVLFGGIGNTDTWTYRNGTWTLLPTSRDPGSRNGAQLVWSGSGLLLHGGDVRRGGELWHFDGSRWSELPGAVPDIRNAVALAFDPGLGTAVMFGGFTAISTLLDDTWVFDRQWRRLRPVHAPSPRASARMALSSVERRLLLYGGSAGLGDTWIWSGSDWLAQSPATVPPPRDLPVLATDPAGGVMLFGGLQAQVNLLGDQWRWDGVNWNQQTPAVLPGPRAAALAVHDPVRDVVVIVGGTDRVSMLAETWEWDGSQWAQRATPPFLATAQIARIAFRPDTGRALVEAGGQHEWNGTAWTTVSQSTNAPVVELFADPRRRRLLAFAGGGWELLVFSPTPATVARYGNGCAIGTAPALSGVGRPMPGNSTFHIAVSTHVPGAPMFVALGSSNAQQSLGSGCYAWVGNVLGVTFLAGSATGEASIALPLPNDHRLRGYELFAQVAVVDPAHGLFQGLTLSEGLRVAIGD